MCSDVCTPCFWKLFSSLRTVIENQDKTVICGDDQKTEFFVCFWYLWHIKYWKLVTRQLLALNNYYMVYILPFHHLVDVKSAKFWTLCNISTRCNGQGLSLLLSICMTCPYCAEYESWINQNWLNQEEGLPDGNWLCYLRITNFNKWSTAYRNFNYFTKM